ncbi:hypothetical protein [Campylobacter jejuni]
MDLIYFFLNLNYAEFLCGLFALSVIFTIPKYTRIIGGICFMLWMISILSTLEDNEDTRVFPPDPYYVDKVVKKYGLEDLKDQYPFNSVLKSSTIGFGICSSNKYEGSLCLGYLEYFENKLIDYKNERLEELEEERKKDRKAFDKAIKQQENINNYLDKE